MRKLPFLNGIRAFEAAARAGSFAKAADELHVTPAAISRMVQLLEQRLGVPLFERKANRLAPTRGGPRLPGRPHAALRSAREPDRAGHRDGGLARAHGRRRADLRDALAHSAARRFPEGRARHRGALRHRRRDACPTTTTGPAASGSATATGPGSRRSSCSPPTSRRSAAPALAKRLKTPEDLRSATLLRVAHAADEWPRWFKAAGVAEASARRDRSSNITARPCRPRPTASASRWASALMSTTT